MVETVKCPACSLSLRGVPPNRRTLVTCPPTTGGCGTKFYHPPTERSTIRFRCSIDGQPFLVTFKREAPHPQFTVERVLRVSEKAGESASSEFKDYVADAYSFDNFYCPCCGFAAEPGVNQTVIVWCNKCSELVCAGLTYTKAEGPGRTVQWFVCYPACGHQGEINGHISEFRATRSFSAHRLAVPELPKPDTPTFKRIG